MTFSGLVDGRRDVVLQTSENFFGPSQFSYYNDMVVIDGDGRSTTLTCSTSSR